MSIIPLSSEPRLKSVALKNFYDFDLESLTEFLVEKEEKPFRAKQLFQWVYGKGISDLSEMTNISRTSREAFKSYFSFHKPLLLRQWNSLDGTKKFLFQVGDGLSVESVLIPSKGRLTLCISSEVGCNLACKFCYTAKQKLKHKLSTAEIVGQYVQASALAEERISNIVYMGMGEPLDNPDAVFASIKIFHEPLGLNLSCKKMTLSTSGIVPLIPRVIESGVRLAVSLNGTNDEVRSKIMPINKRWPLKELLLACLEYTEKSQDKVTFEYVLLKGVTDSIEDAVALHKMLKHIPCKINIIPFNEYPQSGFSRPSEKTVDRFQRKLIDLGAHVLRRKTMGRDISAACGQLTTMLKKEPASQLQQALKN